jgi:hypothetical protein
MIPMNKIVCIVLLVFQFCVPKAGAQSANCAAAAANPIIFQDPRINSCDQWIDTVNVGNAPVAIDGFANLDCDGIAGSSTALYNYWYSFTIPPGTAPYINIKLEILGSCTKTDLNKMGINYYKGICGSLTFIDRICNPFGITTDPSTVERALIRTNHFTPGTKMYIQLYDNNNVNCELRLSIYMSPEFDNCATPVPLTDNSFCNRGGNAGDAGSPNPAGYTGDKISPPGTCIPNPPNNGAISAINNALWFSFTVLPTDPQPYSITMNNITCIDGQRAMQMMVYKANCGNCADVTSMNACYVACSAQNEPPTSTSLTIVPGANTSDKPNLAPGDYF